MADPLAFPDAAIDEFEREAASRCSRLRGEMQSHLDIDNQLENNLVSVLPVVPGPKLETCSSIIDPFDGEGKKAHEGRVREDHSEKLGTTGTAGALPDQAGAGQIASGGSIVPVGIAAMSGSRRRSSCPARQPAGAHSQKLQPGVRVAGAGRFELPHDAGTLPRRLPPENSVISSRRRSPAVVIR